VQENKPFHAVFVLFQQTLTDIRPHVMRKNERGIVVPGGGKSWHNAVCAIAAIIHFANFGCWLEASFCRIENAQPQ